MEQMPPAIVTTPGRPVVTEKGAHGAEPWVWLPVTLQ